MHRRRAFFVLFLVGTGTLLSSRAIADLVFAVGSATVNVGDLTVSIPIDVTGTDPFNSVTVAFGVGDGGSIIGGSDPTIPVINYASASAGAVWDGATVLTSQNSSGGSGVSILGMNLPTATNVTATGTERLMNLTLDLSNATSPGTYALSFDFNNLGNAAVFSAPNADLVAFTFTPGVLTVVPEPSSFLYLTLVGGLTIGPWYFLRTRV